MCLVTIGMSGSVTLGLQFQVETGTHPSRSFIISASPKPMAQMT